MSAQTITRAAPGRRLAAAAVDAGAVGLWTAFWSTITFISGVGELTLPIVTAVLGASAPDVALIAGHVAVVGAIIAFGYDLYGSLVGGPHGKRARQLRVVTVAGDPLRGGRAAARSFVKLLSVLSVVGALPVLGGGRPLHDLAAGTTVVRLHRRKRDDWRRI